MDLSSWKLGPVKKALISKAFLAWFQVLPMFLSSPILAFGFQDYYWIHFWMIFNRIKELKIWSFRRFTEGFFFIKTKKNIFLKVSTLYSLYTFHAYMLQSRAFLIVIY